MSSSSAARAGLHHAVVTARRRLAHEFVNAEHAGSTWPQEEVLADALAPFDPALRTPTARRLFIAGGLHDRIVPSAGPGALSRAWGLAPRLYPRGHISLLFLCRALRRDLAQFALG